jgi:DNA-binding transcriptional MerR regulator
MSPSPHQSTPPSGRASGSLYTLEAVAESLGIHPNRVRYYYRVGLLIQRSFGESGEPLFDDEALYWCSQLHSLQKNYRMKSEALKLVAGLLREIERLTALLRSRQIE